MRLKGKVSVITGAGSGIGRATALLFGREGAKVVCVDMDEVRGIETVGIITQEKQEALFIAADVSKGDEVQHMAEKCHQQVKQVDILFNNAGYLIRQGFEATTEETWFRMLGVNLTGIFLCSKHLLPLIKKAGAGAIINHASIDALLGNPQIAAYSAAKGGIIPLTHVMAYELAQYNIRVNCLCTGGIITGMTASGLRQNLVSVTPMRRMGTTDEIANAVLFLASDEPSYMTGATLVIDGGRTVITPGTF
jgi:NAD(P)-dependent dehydrogenase (short-subunit alcohol dehydrogenase family)